MDIEQRISRFKMSLLRKLPFYGDVIMQLSFVKNTGVPTAATDGRTVWYNPTFMDALEDGEAHFVLMHEVFHVLLRHSARGVNSKRDPLIWNIACDIIINNMLLGMVYDMRSRDIEFLRPSFNICVGAPGDITAEALYEIILRDNKNSVSQTVGSEPGLGKRNLNSSGRGSVRHVKLRSNYRGDRYTFNDAVYTDMDCDLAEGELNAEEWEAQDAAVREIIKTALNKSRGAFGSYFIPSKVYEITNGRVLNWKSILRSFLTQEIGEDSSYTTPERKYLHMDMILPGHSLDEEKLEEVWAFVDSSGSISQGEMTEFLTQLYYISKEFKCILNICFWDTCVTDVYKKVMSEKEVVECVPKHSGGTDINCVYDWIQENKVKPDVMLVLTDGYFGPLTTQAFKRQYRKKTILVLNSDIPINDHMKMIGKIAKL